MMWRRFRDRRVLSDHACWVGDEAGVVVAAETEAVAEEALRLIRVDWEVLPFVLDPFEAMRPGAPVVHPEIAPGNVLPEDPVGGPAVFLDKGDALAALAGAEVVVAGVSTYHNANQGALENWTCLAQWEGGTLTVWSNSYEADQTRMHLSQMLEIPLSGVRVISHYVGGQFGRNDTGDQPFYLFTALLARRTGRPVKFRHSRREAFHDSRQPIVYEGRAGAKADGTITALSFQATGNVGAYADHSVFALKYAPAEVAEVCFAHIPNVRMEARGVYTNKLPGCMMRGVGNSQLNLILGHLVDLLAERLRRDPLDLAVQNFGHRWEALPDRSLAAVLQAGARGIGWEHKRHAPGAGEELSGGTAPRGGLLLPPRLARRVAGAAPGGDPGEPAPQPRRHRAARRPHRRDGDRLEHLQRPRLRRSARLSRGVPGGHHLGGGGGHRARAEGHRADRQRGLLPPVRGAGGRGAGVEGPGARGGRPAVGRAGRRDRHRRGPHLPPGSRAGRGWTSARSSGRGTWCRSW